MATIALNLKEGKLWSAARAMDRTGVDDPEAEQDIIREEQTDATLNPAAVQVMVTLMAILQQIGSRCSSCSSWPPRQAGAGWPARMARVRGDARAEHAGGRRPTSSVAETAEQPEMMPGDSAEGAASAAPTARGRRGAHRSAGAGLVPSQMLCQFQIQEGEAGPRIIGQSTIQKNG